MVRERIKSYSKKIMPDLGATSSIIFNIMFHIVKQPTAPEFWISARSKLTFPFCAVSHLILRKRYGYIIFLYPIFNSSSEQDVLEIPNSLILHRILTHIHIIWW